MPGVALLVKNGNGLLDNPIPFLPTSSIPLSFFISVDPCFLGVLWSGVHLPLWRADGPVRMK